MTMAVESVVIRTSSVFLGLESEILWVVKRSRLVG